MESVERYEVFLRIADGDDDHCLYMIEHWFADRPEIETVSALFDEAKRDFVALYPDLEPEDFSVRGASPSTAGRSPTSRAARNG